MELHYILNAIEAALKAGTQILSIYNDPCSDFGIEQKADHSPLTIADKKSHAVIQEELAHTPYPILSEEGKLLPFEERMAWHTLWVVDPLDGTKEFIKRNGEFTVNIALVHQGIPVMGVIYLPVKQELYFAADDLGAFKLEGITALEGRTIDALIEASVHLPQKEEREQYVVVASRSHLSQETEDYISLLKQQHRQVELISCGSSIKICRVAEGKADVYPRFAPTMEWDTAAGHAIARAAGMEIYQVGLEEPLRYNKENLLNPWFIVEPKHETIVR